MFFDEKLRDMAQKLEFFLSSAIRTVLSINTLKCRSNVEKYQVPRIIIKIALDTAIPIVRNFF